MCVWMHSLVFMIFSTSMYGGLLSKIGGRLKMLGVAEEQEKSVKS